jgi:hypothetical protein
VEDPPASWRSRLKRWRWWIAAVTLVVSVRVALPVVLRWLAASQASAALHARVDVGDVDLALWKGGVALEDVAVYALASQGEVGAAPDTGAGPAPRVQPERTAGEPLPKLVQDDSGGRRPGESGLTPPSAPAPTERRPPEDAPTARRPPEDAAAPGSVDAGAPIVAFKRFAVELRYWPLFSKTIQLRDVALEGPRTALDRLASGDLNIMALVPESEVAVEAGATPGAPDAGATPTPTAAGGAAPPSPWKLGLDRFVLRDGRLRFRDFALAGSEPVEVGIDEVSVQEIALNPGVYGEPARVNLKLGVDAGAIDVAARFELIDAGVAVTCDVTAQRLPLRRARLYVPKVGWSDLKGELDLALTYTLQSNATNEVHGTIGLREVAIAVPNLEDVAVAWKSLDVKIETVDLLAQRAAVESVALDGAKLYVRAQGDQPLPVLAQSAPPAGAASPPPEPQPTPAAEAQGEPSPPAEPPRPWQWSVANVRLSNSTVEILSDQPTLGVDVDLTATNLASAADAIAHVALGLGIPPASVKVDGDLRIAAPAFGGTMKIADLDLPPLLAASGAVDPSLLPSAILKTDLAIEAGLPSSTGGATVEPHLLRVRGGVGLGDTRVAPPGGELAVALKRLDLAIDELVVPGVIPIGHKADNAAAIRLAARLDVQEPNLTRGGEQPMRVDAQSIGLALSDVTVPAALAGLAPAESAQPIHAVAQLEVTAPRVGLDAAAVSAEARTIRLAVSDASISTVPPDGSVSAAAPARVVAQLDLDESKVTIAEGKQLAAGAQSIGLQLSEVTLPGVTMGAPPIDTGAPVHAVATLTVAQPRAVRGDGKEFSFTAKSIAVPLSDLSLAGALAPPPGGAQTVRAAFGDIRIEAPVARLTRTKDGMVLPGTAPAPASAPAPAAADSAPAAVPAPASGNPPLEVSVASLRISNGDVDFTDRAVQPAFHDRYAPVDLEARNLRFPNPAVKPLKLALTSAEQGRITATGDFGPQGGSLDLVMDKFPLTPFNPYATTYSPYGISEGALTLKTTAKLRGGKYEVTNAITLHQLDLTGVEGDSLFEQQFGVPLSLALALLRDTAGDIDLNVPVAVDQSGGATVDVVGVVRSALRQALFGAIQSPLKLVGGVIGAGGKRGRIAPAPIAFPLGRSEPTAAGAESVQRLASFLAERPAMAVQLDTSVTADDVRWLHEQSLRSQWAEEGFFQRTFAFVTQRGPRSASARTWRRAPRAPRPSCRPRMPRRCSSRSTSSRRRPASNSARWPRHESTRLQRCCASRASTPRVSVAARRPASPARARRW